MDDRVAIETYLEMRRSGMGERQAARQFGVSHREIQQYADMNPDFAAALEDALLERLERVEAKMWEAAQEGSETAAKTVLESHAPVEWSKPSPEMILKVQREVEDIDVPDLLKRLEAAKAQQEQRALGAGDE
jgi:hypothetical protein